MSASDERNGLGPEELVRRENRLVSCLKVLLVVVLIVVGSSLSLSCYKLTSGWEEREYKNEFSVISLSFVGLFHQAMTQVMWNAYTIGVAVSASPDTAMVAPNITIPSFNRLPAGALQTNNLNNVFWSPFITDGIERNKWEVYAQHALQAVGFISSNSCFVCGSVGFEVGLPSASVLLPIGTYTCGTSAWTSRKLCILSVH
jgi:hypothetical protein